MKFLKSLALGFLSFLLFLALSLFGLAFTLNSTILNPHFMTAELNRLNVSLLAEELLSQPTAAGEFPPELKSALMSALAELEPAVKEQVNAFTDPTYDYLLGQSQNLDLALTLRNTILNTDFVVSLVDKLDTSALVSPFIKKSLQNQVTQGTIGIPIDTNSLTKLVEDAIHQLEPQIKEQMRAAVGPMLDYLLGQRQSFKVIISLEAMKQTLGENLRQTLLKSPPSELASIPPAQLEQYFSQFYPAFSALIPSTFEINESLLGTQMPANIAQALAQAEVALGQARQIISYFQLGYRVLIGFILLLILSIILLTHQVRGATRQLGTIFLTYGALEYAGSFAAKYLVGTRLPLPEIPPALQTWLPQFLNNFSAPLERLSLGLLVAGVALLIVSFVYRHQPSS